MSWTVRLIRRRSYRQCQRRGRMLVPDAFEQRLPVGQYRAGDAHRGLAPAALRMAGIVELVGEPGATHECDLAVHDQQLAMIAEGVREQLAVAQRVVIRHVDVCLVQQLAVGARQAPGTEIVGEHLDHHPAPRRLRKGVDEPVGDGSGLEQIDFQQDAAPCPHDGVQHARKILAPVPQQFEVVARTPGELVLGMGGIAHARGSEPRRRSSCGSCRRQ
jgi:hypothetical protein